ncbi:MAG: hypothetical protein KF696_01470 [Planctomycetes bacterium]|nr:hypothetical protein [Planctomycetota bacterium]MCW8134390.1 hypothetical protein [Planctomycetota bacterium]
MGIADKTSRPRPLVVAILAISLAVAIGTSVVIWRVNSSRSGTGVEILPSRLAASKADVDGTDVRIGDLPSEAANQCHPTDSSANRYVEVYAAKGETAAHGAQEPNPAWLTGAVQDGFYHSPPGGPLVRDTEEENEEYLPSRQVKEVIRFDDWPLTEGLLPGFRFQLSDWPEFAEFTVHSDRRSASFEQEMAHHGVKRVIQLRRRPDRAWVSIVLVVGMSAATAREQLVPRLYEWNEAALAALGTLVHLGDIGNVALISSHHDGSSKVVRFTRRNIYVSLEAGTLEGQSIPGIDLLKIARTLDAQLQQEKPVDIEQLQALRPRITRFDLSKELLKRSSEATNQCEVAWTVESPRGAGFVVFADGTGDLQYDDRANPSRIHGRAPGRETARLVAIDDYLLFDWRDVPVEVVQ